MTLFDQIAYEVVYIFFIAVALGLLTGIIADRKGRSFVGWFIFGAAFALLALPLAIFLPPKESRYMKRCPRCAEMIQRAALACRYCGHEYYTPKSDKDDLRWTA